MSETIINSKQSKLIDGKERDYYYDNIKAFAVFLVVFGHCLSNISTLSRTDTEIIYRIIYSVHMPLFMYVSGYFSKFNPKKIVLYLALPYIVFQFAIFVFMNLVGGDKTPTLSFFVPQYATWYLLALVVFRCLIPFFELIPDKYKWMFFPFSIAIAVVCGFSKYINPEFVADKVLCFAPFFFFGYYQKNTMKKQYLFSRKWLKITIIAISILCTGAIVLLTFYQPGHSKRLQIYGPYQDIDSTWYYRLLVITIAFITIAGVLAAMPKKRIPLVSRLGSRTMPIYIGHVFVLFTLKLLMYELKIPRTSSYIAFGIAIIITFATSYLPDWKFIIDKTILLTSNTITSIRNKKLKVEQSSKDSSV